MKTEIRVKVSNGEILEVKTHASHILNAGAGERIEEYEGDARPYAGMILSGKNTVRVKNSDEIPAKSQKESRLNELKEKKSLSNDEITEVLKMWGLI